MTICHSICEGKEDTKWWDNKIFFFCMSNVLNRSPFYTMQFLYAVWPIDALLYIQYGTLKTHCKDTSQQSERKDTAVDWGAETDGGTKKASKDTTDSAKASLCITNDSPHCLFVLFKNIECLMLECIYDTSYFECHLWLFISIEMNRICRIIRRHHASHVMISTNCEDKNICGLSMYCIHKDRNHNMYVKSCFNYQLIFLRFWNMSIYSAVSLLSLFPLHYKNTGLYMWVHIKGAKKNHNKRLCVYRYALMCSLTPFLQWSTQ